MADVIRAWLKNPIGLTTAQVLYLHAQKVFRGRSFAPDPHCGMEIEIAPDPSFPRLMARRGNRTWRGIRKRT
jgi:hypothetical protein